MRMIFGIAAATILAVDIASAQENPWMKPERPQAVVLVEVSYPEYDKPAVSTGFLVEGAGRYYVLTSEHGLMNSFASDASKVTVPIARCSKLDKGNLRLILKEKEPQTVLTTDGCIIKIGHDVSLIPVTDSLNKNYTLTLVSRPLKKWDQVFLAGYYNGLPYLDTTGSGPVSMTDLPPDMTARARVNTTPGMSGGPYLLANGTVVGIHRGGLQYVPGFAEFTPIEKIRSALESVLGPIKTDVMLPAGEPPRFESPALATRISDLVALQSLPDAEKRVQAWSIYKERPVTNKELNLLTNLPNAYSPSSMSALPPGLPPNFNQEQIADFLYKMAAEQRDRCLVAPEIVDGILKCGGMSTLLPSSGVGRDMTPTLIVLHYAGASSFKGVVSFLSQGIKTQASVHFVIDRDGTIVQLVPTNRTAAHAGQGIWMGQSGLNNRSIGIEFINEGRLQHNDGGEGSEGPRFFVSGGQKIPINEGIGINGSDDVTVWHRYTSSQIAAAEALARALAKAHKISDIIGHCNIDARRVDPGPAFPLQAFGEIVIGKRAPNCDYRM